jgi:O-antigen/teichoic acid export membrane protein
MRFGRLTQLSAPLLGFFQSIGAQAAIVFINLLTGVITARLLGPEGRGIFAAVTVWPQLFALLAIAGVGNAVVFRLNKAPDAAAPIVTATFVTGALTSLIAVVAGLVITPYALAKYDPATIFLAQLCLVGVFINAFQMLIKQTFAGFGAYGLFSLANLSSQLAYLLILLVTVILVPLTSTFAILGLIGSGVLGLVVLLPSFFRLVRPGFDGLGDQLPILLSYSYRSAGFDIVMALSNYIDRLVLIFLLPAKLLGLYAVAYSFSRLVQLAQPAIASVLFSTMSALNSVDAKQLHDRTYRFLLLLLAAGCALLWLVGPAVMTFMYGREFGEATAIFRILIMEAALGVLGQITVQLFMSLDRPGVVSFIQTEVLVFTVVTLIALVPMLGTLGAAVGLLMAAILRLILLFRAIKSTLQLSLPRPYLDRNDLAYLRDRLGFAR